MTETTSPLQGIIVSATDDLGGQLLTIQGRPIIEVFTTPGLVSNILEAVCKAAIVDAPTDVSTDKARKAVASHAFKATKTKTYLDNLGKAEVDRLKALPKQIDESRRLLREGLDALAAELRQPLTEWEANQDRLKRKISVIRNTPGDLMTSRGDSKAIQIAIDMINAQDTSEHEFGEFASEAASAKTMAISQLEQMLEDSKKREAEAEELERLRKEKAERDRLEHEEQLRKEGEARALSAQHNVTNTTATVATVHVESTSATELGAGSKLQAPIDNPYRDAVSDVEHRRTYNREAMADMLPFLAGDQTAAESILRAIVTGKVRHIKIEY